MWTQFMDMHSGGGQKLAWAYIYIEAPQAEARVIFYNRFKRNPDRVTCTCCGGDYSLTESATLEEATAYNRGCAYVYRRPDGTACDMKEAWVPGKGQRKGYTAGYEEASDKARGGYRNYIALADYLADKSIKVIRAAQIKRAERLGDVPEEGYVWAGE